VGAVRNLRAMTSSWRQEHGESGNGNGGPSSLRQVISVGRHQLFADEPKASGGHDEGPDPYELLLSAFGIMY